jgi:hypothetical protein
MRAPHAGHSHDVDLSSENCLARIAKEFTQPLSLIRLASGPGREQ